MITCRYPRKHDSPLLISIIDAVLGERLGLAYTTEASDDSDYLLCAEGRQLVVRDAFLALAHDRWLQEDTLPRLPLKTWDTSAIASDLQLIDTRVPVLFGEGGLHMDALGNASLDLDVFGSALFMMSRYEEVVVKERDHHDRFPATASIAFKAGFLERPLIDEYVELLWGALRRVWPGLVRKRTSSHVFLSHDVDSASQVAFLSPLGVLRVAASTWFRKKRASDAVRLLDLWTRSRKRLQPDDPHNQFEWIMSKSEAHGLISAFYFISGRTSTEYDAVYDLENPAIRALLRAIHERGHEIGLHPSYNTYKDPVAIASEAHRLKSVCAQEGVEQTVWGGRMHYLRWETPITLDGWELAKMTYDSTLSFADRPGFRCGTCHEYAALDPVARARLNVRIRPLIAMECTVLDDRYMGLGVTSAAFDKFVQLKNACRIVGGAFTLLWHNSRLVSERERELYCAVLAA